MSDPDLRRSVIEDVHAALGAKMGPFAGWLMPIEYEGVLSEHRAVRERVGLFDLSHLGKVDAVGAGAPAVLQQVVTNELSRVEVERAQYNLVLNDAGGVEEDLIVYHLAEERWFLVPNAANTEKVVRLLRRTAGEAPATADDVRIEQHDWCFFGIQGPRSLEVVGALFPEAADLPFMGCTTSVYAGREIVVTRSGYTGELGFELFCEPEVGAQLWADVMEEGAAFQIEPCGLGARDVLRLEMGYPLYGQDLLPERTALEAGLSWAVAFEKGGFIGRDALLRQRETGPPSRLRGLITRGRRHIPRPHQRVRVGDQVAGEVTSGTYSPTLEAGIALAYLSPPARSEPGAEVQVDVRGRIASARVVKPPFVERDPRRP